MQYNALVKVVVMNHNSSAAAEKKLIPRIRICTRLYTAESLWQELQQCALKLRNIPRLAKEFGLAAEITQHPKINLDKLEAKLAKWGFDLNE
mgnify:CR=1 FL=1